MNKKAGDEHLGVWVYCYQHRGPHKTGWCTVAPEDKVPLEALTRAEAFEEVKFRKLDEWKGPHHQLPDYRNSQ